MMAAELLVARTVEAVLGVRNVLEVIVFQAATVVVQASVYATVMIYFSAMVVIGTVL
jgi:hypothetical protein